MEKLKEIKKVSSSNSNMGQVQQLSTEYRGLFVRSENYKEGDKVFFIIN